MKNNKGENVCELSFKIEEKHNEYEDAEKGDFEPNALKQSPDKHETENTKHNEYNDFGES